MARAYRDESVGAFHRWRKQAKYLRYQMEVITRSNPAEIPALVVSLEEIGAGLGTDHDLADLLSTVTGSGEVFASRIGLDGLIDAIAHRRTVIESEVRPIAERVYAQLPHEFCDRMMLGI
jgi:CHAD domain-containing protein